MTKRPKPRTFKWLSEPTINKDHFEIKPWLSRQLRSKLSRGVYWVQPIERGQVSWNLELLTDYLINGEGEGHKILVEEYIATLPQSA